LGIKHATTKADNQTGFASEWNAAHTIEAGTIVNADVNAAAAIALSKLAVPDACRAYMSANTAIPTTEWTTIALDAELYDNHTMHDLVTNNSRITCKTAGLYLICSCVTWADGVAAGALRGQGLRLNGATISEVQYAKAIYAGNSNSLVYPLAVNDYVELKVYQDSGGNLNARGGSVWTWLSLAYLGRT
jgi:hypothetical protein